MKKSITANVNDDNFEANGCIIYDNLRPPPGASASDLEHWELVIDDASCVSDPPPVLRYALTKDWEESELLVVEPSASYR